MVSRPLNAQLMQFLHQSPTPFHAVSNLSEMLELAGFERLSESEHWDLEKGEGYFVVRNDSALIAFRGGSGSMVSDGFRITGSHTDSPGLKIKPLPTAINRGYVQLGVEVYGGALLAPWFDRDLSIAGRVHFQTKQGQIKSTLIDFKSPIAFIPSLAIHLNRNANEGNKINRQKELPPIMLTTQSGKNFDFDNLLLTTIRKNSACRNADAVLSHELLLYDTQPPCLVGLEEEFIASARLDNLLSCYLTCVSLIESKKKFPGLMVCNDHEEVGSVSSSGAQGPFLRSVLERILRSETPDDDAFDRAISNSDFWSIDNAHGIHPNYSEKHDEQHSPSLNLGPVIKINANQRYASNSKSIALFKSICKKENIPFQSFAMRSDMACGSTIGPISASEIGVETLDIGLASFGMHSIRELSGARDTKLLKQVVTAFYNR